MRARGFTLVELLVSLFITAVVFAVGYGAMNQAIGNREAIERQQARLVEIQRTMRVLVQDFSQLAQRPVRDPVGQLHEPAVFARQSGETTRSGVLVLFTRAGWNNPAGIQRASLQRVRYLLVDGTLRREGLPVLDAAGELPARGRDLLKGVTAVRFRYMTDGSNWIDTFPPPGLTGPERFTARPAAVEVTLDLADYGRLQRVIEVGY